MTPILGVFFAQGSTAVQIVLLLLILIYVALLCASRLNVKFLRTSAILILIAGTGLYCHGYSLEAALEGPVTIFIRSLLSSVEMFVSHSDLFEIEEAQREPFFLEIFIFVYACAVITSISAILAVFGKRVHTIITLALSRRRKFRHIFLGFDRNSIYLAKNITDGSRIAFIEFPEEEEVEEMSFGGILQNVLHGVVDKYGLNTANVTILKAKKKVGELTPGKDMLSQMGLSALRPVTDENTCFYIFSDNADKNLEAVNTLITDEYFRTHTIHCSAHKQGLTRQYELSLFDTHVHFFYPSTIGVTSLREHGECHPVRVVDIAKDEDGKALGYVNDKSFNALITGFGEGGREMVKFIFEYASFIKADGDPLTVKCYVQDTNMPALSGSFKAAIPSLPHGESIVYETVSCLSEDFWNKMQARLDTLKYVVFCTGSEELNLTAATEVLDYAIRNRKGGLDDFVVLARVANVTARVHTICDFYNWRAGKPCLAIFGDRADVFSPDWTVSGNSVGIPTHSVNLAHQLHDAYYKGLGIDPPSWESRNEICRKAKSDHDFPTLMGQVRFLSQYIASAYHAETESLLAKGNEDILCSIPFDQEEFMQLPESQRQLIDNISAMAHLRWCHHLMLDGYSYADKTDEMAKTNRLLTDWKSLDEEDKHLFRMNVKGVFIYIKDNRLKINE